MRKFINLMLLLLVLSTASVNAQVTIGTDAPPHSSAVLDLQSNTLGFKLPTIELGDVAVFQLLGTEDEADGIMVYNSSEETTGGSGKGIYVWNGSKWNFAGKSGQIVPADIPVENIKITSAGYVTEIKASGAGSTLQLTATVEPAEASQEVIWSKVYSAAATAGDVTVDANGLVTGVKAGTVTVRATATDGSGVYRNLALTVKPTGYVTDITVTPINGSSTIEVGKTLQLETTITPLSAYPDVTWSTENSAFASVNSTTGLVSGLAEGSTTVTATAADGSGVIGTFLLTVIASTLPPLASHAETIGGIEYQVYDYAGLTWMVEDVRHGTPDYDFVPGYPNRLQYYFRYDHRDGLCDGLFRIPSYEDAVHLQAALNSPFLDGSELSPWFSAQEMTGYVNRSGSLVDYDNRRLQFYDNDTPGYFATRVNKTLTLSFYASGWSQSSNASLPVRCVRDTD